MPARTRQTAHRIREAARSLGRVFLTVGPSDWDSVRGPIRTAVPGPAADSTLDNSRGNFETLLNRIQVGTQ